MKRKFSPSSLALGMTSARIAVGGSLPALIAISMSWGIMADPLEAAPAIQEIGSVSVNGENVELSIGKDGDLHPADDQQLRRIRAKLGMVFQNFNLWPHMTVLQNLIEAPLRVLKLNRAEAVARGEALLEKVGLYGRRNDYPAYLSGGQQQRVAIARTLCMEPDVMLFDEPTSALDPELAGEVLGVIRNLAREGRTMVLVTHELRFARELSSYVQFLLNGRVEEEGTPQDVFGNPKSVACRQFLSSVRH